MQDGVFSGLFGALTTEHRMNMIANNLANVNTHGYKRDTVAFKDTMSYYAHDEVREPLATCRSKPLFPEPKNLARPRLAVSQTDFSQGSLHYTGNPLDVAIAGNAFFKFATPEGEFLSRQGGFLLSGDGTIVTPRGYPVRGTAGNIVVPQGARNVHISEDGQVFADNIPLGNFALVTVSDFKALEKQGHNMYKLREGSSAEERPIGPNEARVAQGYMEKANVEVVYEMVNMIEVQRLFEAYQKVMQTSDTLDRAAISQVARRT
jgi:flagellar basal-body rod protein FlgG